MRKITDDVLHAPKFSEHRIVGPDGTFQERCICGYRFKQFTSTLVQDYIQHVLDACLRTAAELALTKVVSLHELHRDAEVLGPVPCPACKSKVTIVDGAFLDCSHCGERNLLQEALNSK
jgi:hypothetical protein